MALIKEPMSGYSDADVSPFWTGNRSIMPDWKKAIRERLAPAKLNPMLGAEVVEELAANLDDRYQ